MFVCIGPNTKFPKIIVKIWGSRMIKDDQGLFTCLSFSQSSSFLVIFFPAKFAEIFSEFQCFSDFLIKAIIKLRDDSQNLWTFAEIG